VLGHPAFRRDSVVADIGTELRTGSEPVGEELLTAVVIVDVEHAALRDERLGRKAPDVVVDLPVVFRNRIEGIYYAVAYYEVQIPVARLVRRGDPGVGVDAVSLLFPVRFVPADRIVAIVIQLQPVVGIRRVQFRIARKGVDIVETGLIFVPSRPVGGDATEE